MRRLEKIVKTIAEAMTLDHYDCEASKRAAIREIVQAAEQAGIELRFRDEANRKEAGRAR